MLIANPLRKISYYSVVQCTPCTCRVHSVSVDPQNQSIRNYRILHSSGIIDSMVKAVNLKGSFTYYVFSFWTIFTPHGHFSATFPKISILRYILLQKLHINVAIRHILMYSTIVIVSTTFPGGNAKNHGSYELRQAKNRFSAIFRKISILRYICCFMFISCI